MLDFLDNFRLFAFIVFGLFGLGFAFVAWMFIRSRGKGY
jgi:hypothetical protein